MVAKSSGGGKLKGNLDETKMGTLFNWHECLRHSNLINEMLRKSGMYFITTIKKDVNHRTLRKSNKRCLVFEKKFHTKAVETQRKEELFIFKQIK